MESITVKIKCNTDYMGLIVPCLELSTTVVIFIFISLVIVLLVAITTLVIWLVSVITMPFTLIDVALIGLVSDVGLVTCMIKIYGKKQKTIK